MQVPSWHLTTYTHTQFFILSFIKTCQKGNQNTKNTGETFGGFQRGFLNKKKTDNDVNKVSEKTAAEPEKEIATISPKSPTSDNLRIPEVQEAMKTSLFLQNKGTIEAIG